MERDEPYRESIRLSLLPPPILRPPTKPGNAVRSSKLLRRRRLVSIDFWYRPNYTRPPPPSPINSFRIYEDDRSEDRIIVDFVLPANLRDRSIDRSSLRLIQLWKLFTFSIFDIEYNLFPKILKLIEQINRDSSRFEIRYVNNRSCKERKEKDTNIVGHTRLNAQFRHTEKQNTSQSKSNRGKNGTTSGCTTYGEPCKGN